jgi:hypothetical protein
MTPILKSGKDVVFAIKYPPWVKPHIVNRFAFSAAPRLTGGPRSLPFFS